jgi:glycosyltransferase involved in cell wall biosynthesis
MLVSVVLPVYNNSNIMNELQEKIKNLNSFYEVIIIDDCSTDNTYETLCILKERESLQNVTLLKNESNRGPSYSRNIGLEKSTGDYIAFLDSDDDWHPQKIEIQIEMMQRTKSKICGTVHKNITQTELDNSKQIQYSMQDINYSIISWPKILFKTPFATPSVVIDKCLKHYRFDETMKYAEDYNLWKKITYEYRAIKILLPLTYTFKHDYISQNSCLSGNLRMMQQGVNKSFISILQYEKVIRFYKPLILIALVFSQIKYIIRLVKFKLFILSKKRGH